METICWLFLENVSWFEQSKLLYGWQNFIKGTQPRTNIALEWTNHAIKFNVTDHKKLEFGTYLKLLRDNLEERSDASSKAANFPKISLQPTAV